MESNLLLVLLSIAAVPLESVFLNLCPKGWTEFNGECLYFGSTLHTWLDAASICRHMNHSYLASDDNSDKHNFIKQIAEVFYSMKKTNFWIGGSDFGTEGEWRWLETGRPLGIDTHWADGSPDGNNTENCMAVDFFGNDFRWKDAACHWKHYFICERPALSSQGILIG